MSHLLGGLAASSPGPQEWESQLHRTPHWLKAKPMHQSWQLQPIKLLVYCFLSGRWKLPDKMFFEAAFYSNLQAPKIRCDDPTAAFFDILLLHM